MHFYATLTHNNSYSLLSHAKQWLVIEDIKHRMLRKLEFDWWHIRIPGAISTLLQCQTSPKVSVHRGSGAVPSLSQIAHNDRLKIRHKPLNVDLVYLNMQMCTYIKYLIIIWLVVLHVNNIRQCPFSLTTIDPIMRYHINIFKHVKEKSGSSLHSHVQTKLSRWKPCNQDVSFWVLRI